MDRGRATCGGHKPTAPTTMLIRGCSEIDAYYATGLGLRSTMERAEVLGGSLHLDVRPRGCPSTELRVPSTDSNPSGQAKEALIRGSTRVSH